MQSNSVYTLISNIKFFKMYKSTEKKLDIEIDIENLKNLRKSPTIVSHFC